MEIEHAPNRNYFGRQVSMAASRLPIAQAKAIWLVDICGCDYATAATATNVPVHDFVAELHAGRRSIKRHLDRNDHR